MVFPPIHLPAKIKRASPNESGSIWRDFGTYVRKKERRFANTFARYGFGLLYTSNGYGTFTEKPKKIDPPTNLIYCRIYCLGMKKTTRSGNQKGSASQWIGNIRIQKDLVDTLSAERRAADKARRDKAQRARQTVDRKARYLSAAWAGDGTPSDPRHAAARAMGANTKAEREAIATAYTQLVYPGGRSA